MLETVVLDDFSDITLVVGTEDEDGDDETGSTGSVGSVQRVKVSSSVLRLFPFQMTIPQRSWLCFVLHIFDSRKYRIN